MKNRNYLIAGLIAASLMLISLSSQAQPTRRTVTVNGQVLPVPDDASTGTARAVVGITIPVVDPGTCTRTNNNCYKPGDQLPTSGGASGSQCGWVPFYSGYIGARLPCNGNTLALGNSPICPAGATLTAYDNKCKGITQGTCGSEDFPYPCDIQVEVPAIGYSLQPATYYTQITNWNCPAGYSPFNVVSGGGSNGNDYFWTCVKS
jgi:hypothetical protein